MRLKYRVLKGRFDSAAFFAEWKSGIAQDRRDLSENAETITFLNGPLWLLLAVPLAAFLRLFSIFEALVSGARKVETTEGEGSEGQLHALLMAGRIKRTDLVQIEGHWQSFSDSALFSDTCDEVERKGRWLEWLTLGLSIALASVLFAFLVWALFTFPGRLLDWAKE